MQTPDSHKHANLAMQKTIVFSGAMPQMPGLPFSPARAFCRASVWRLARDGIPSVKKEGADEQFWSHRPPKAPPKKHCRAVMDKSTSRRPLLHSRQMLIYGPGTPRIINVSSGAGSVTIRLNPKWDHPMLGRNIQYRASKAAENMISAGIWREVEPLGKPPTSPWC